MKRAVAFVKFNLRCFSMILVSLSVAQANTPPSLLDLCVKVVRKEVLRKKERDVCSDFDLVLEARKELESFKIPNELVRRIIDRGLQVAAGSQHSFYLTENGKVYSFGKGSVGQLGHGDRENQYSPKWIESLDLAASRVIQIQAGYFHTLVLTDSGDVFTFGSGAEGQLGHGDLLSQFTPKLLSSEELDGHRVTQVAAGSFHSLLLTESGQVFSFGLTLNGALGYETPAHQNHQSIPKQIELEGLNGHRVTQVAAGSFHSLLLTDSGQVFSFGNGAQGQLGFEDSQNLPRWTPKRIESEALEDQKVIQIAAGSFHSLLLTESGQVFSFGDSSYGQLGLGETRDRDPWTPTRIESDLLRDEKVIQVVAGSFHSLLVTESGQVFAFGNGTYGQLGNGNLQIQSIPQPIDPSKFNDSKITRAAAGLFHSLFLTENGDLFSFGSSSDGQLGIGK
jgi:alpha-tubulin suppressor-like RCC1 family protein